MTNEQIILELVRENLTLKRDAENYIRWWQNAKKQVEEKEIEILELKEASNGN
jgi:hypothetical protein